MPAAMTLSGSYISHAREAYILSAKERLGEKVYSTKDNNYSEHALVAYVLSTCALEAFINEACFTETSGLLSQAGIAKQPLEMLEIRTKYYLLPLLLWKRTYDRGGQPYQDFDVLTKVRNLLVHYQLKMYEIPQRPRFLAMMASKGLLLPGTNFPWPTELLTAKAALWAHNTACAMVQRFVELGGEEGRLPFPPAGNFQEIPEASYREIVGEESS